MTKAEMIEPIVAYEKREELRRSLFLGAMRLKKEYIKKVYDLWLQDEHKDNYEWRVMISKECYLYDKDGNKI